MFDDNFLFVEKYRPSKVSDCILPESLKKTFQEYVNRKEIPNLLLVGGAGVGKTTIAKALCNEVGCDYLFINASDENGIDTLRNKISNYASSVSLSGGRKVVILDEFDASTNNFQSAFRNFLETFSKNCTFILTANFGNKIIQPIHSRCAVVEFKVSKEEKKVLLTQFFKRVCWILDQEKVDYDKEAIAAFVTKHFPDNRRILNEIQRYSVQGKIDVGILTQVGDIQLKDLVKYLKEKDFTKTREWVVNNLNNDPNTIYRKIYDGMYDIVKPNYIPELVLTIAKYQYQTGFVADAEIQMIAFFIEVMANGEFK
jgi:DNA polymerase III delta prime subunit